MVYGGSGGSASVSSQLHIVPTYDSHHTKGESLNSLIKAADSTFPKRSHPPFTYVFLTYTSCPKIFCCHLGVKNNQNIAKIGDVVQKTITFGE